ARRFDAPLNLMFCLALEAAARLSKAFGEPQAATDFAAAADRVRAGIVAAFWDPGEGAFQSYVDSDKPRHFAEFTQSLALLARVPAPADAARLRQRLVQPDNGMIATTLSHCHYKFEALLMEPQKYGRWVFDAIERDWGSMLRRG